MRVVKPCVNIGNQWFYLFVLVWAFLTVWKRDCFVKVSKIALWKVKDNFSSKQCFSEIGELDVCFFF